MVFRSVNTQGPDLEVVTRTRCRNCNNIEWDWPVDSDMGEAPPAQELLSIVPTSEPVETSVQAAAPVFVPEPTPAPTSATQDAPNNATAVQTVVTMMQRYGVQHKPYMKCGCGCEIMWKSLGSWVCCRCEPGNLWPDNYVAAIKEIYPRKKGMSDANDE